MICMVQLLGVLAVSEAFVLFPYQTSSTGLSYRVRTHIPPNYRTTERPAAPISIRASSQSSPVASDLCGVYTWTYSGGSFPVELRSDGNFFCKSYPSSAKWELQGNTLKIDWKKYGKYELQVNSPSGQHSLPSFNQNPCTNQRAAVSQIKDSAARTMEGSVVGNPSSWRKAEFSRPFTPVESCLGNGGSVWKWEYAGGSFEVR